MKTADKGFELSGESVRLRDLIAGIWQSRSLVVILARRDFYTRYRRPSLGVIWALVFPVLQAGILSVVFVIFLAAVSEPIEIPYPVFALSGTLPWYFFSSTVGASARSITQGAGMASKVYFPRAVLPLVTTGSSLYGFIPSLAVFFVLVGGFVVVGFDIHLSAMSLVIFPAVLVMIALSTALGLVVAAAQVYFRDVAYGVTALMQPLFYVSLVFYSMDQVPERIQILIMANPATGMIELFRIPLLGIQPHSLMSVAFTLAWTVVFLLAAAFIYRRFDRVFADRM